MITIALPLFSNCALLRGPAAFGPPVDSSHPKRYVCRYTNERIQIDGRLDEPVWSMAKPSEWFVDIRGSAGPEPRYRTRMRMLWDERYLYIAAELQEPHVRATLTQRDSIVFKDNDFEVFLDPNGDARNYYEIEINAWNTIFDLLLVRSYRNNGPALHDWNLSGLMSAVFVDGTINDPSDIDGGWTVEMALPWAALGEYAGVPAPPATGDVWRMNFSRVQWPHRVVHGRYGNMSDAKEDNWVWSPQGLVDMHLPQRWGYVEFQTADFPTRRRAGKP